MDWSTNDYTQTFADTIYVPETGADTGIYLLDEAGDSQRDAPDDRARVPIRPYDYRHGRPARHPGVGVPSRPGGREGYYTGGNIISDRENNHAVFDVAWDERPMHYNPNAGAEWAHLVPSQTQRPYGGGPAPSLAFPMITNSEAQVSPKDFFTPGKNQGNPDAKARAAVAEITLAVLKVVLFVILAILLAMAIIAVGRAARAFDRMAVSVAALLKSLKIPAPVPA